ncbi:TolB family protein [uncultured Fibrella sp.]|uniref:TolB family protein n=1 Tax=uncultured Fibrella sp. TaxID=1284596 RepID=UPI0035CA1557
MNYKLLICLFTILVIGCKSNEVAPSGYLKSLSLGVEPLPDGLVMKWAPTFYFEEGMYSTPGSPKPVSPTQYEIYMSEQSEKDLVRVAVVNGDVQQYTLRNLTSGKTVYAQVKATHPKLASSGSRVVTTNVGTLSTALLLFPSNTPYIAYGAWGGSSLVYEGIAGIEVRRSDGSVRTLKSVGTMPVLSPDGQYVAFLGGRNNNTSYSTQVFIEHVDSGTVKLLDTQRSIFTVEWSSDGKKLAYVANGAELWIVSVSNGGASRLGSSLGGLYSDQIDWSSDDTYIVVSQQKDVPSANRTAYNLVRVPLNGGNPTPLLASDWYDNRPSFSPDGQQLAFVSDRSGYNAIWVMNLKTLKINQLTSADERLSYQTRLDWRTNTQLTFSTYLPTSLAVNVSLKQISLP